jgi:hypothetical protein
MPGMSRIIERPYAMQRYAAPKGVAAPGQNPKDSVVRMP